MIAFASILADSGDEYWGHMNGWGGGWMWLWGVAMMIFLVVLVVWLIRDAGRPPAAPAQRDPADRAKEILAERYAKGDITTDEYRERVGELQ